MCTGQRKTHLTFVHITNFPTPRFSEIWLTYGWGWKNNLVDTVMASLFKVSKELPHDVLDN